MAQFISQSNRGWSAFNPVADESICPMLHHTDYFCLPFNFLIAALGLEDDRRQRLRDRQLRGRGHRSININSGILLLLFALMITNAGVIRRLLPRLHNLLADRR